MADGRMLPDLGIDSEALVDARLRLLEQARLMMGDGFAVEQYVRAADLLEAHIMRDAFVEEEEVDDLSEVVDAQS